MIKYQSMPSYLLLSLEQQLAHDLEGELSVRHLLGVRPAEEPVDDAARHGRGQAALHQVHDGQRGLSKEKRFIITAR